MDNFKIIYRILRILEKAMDLEEFDKSSISKERLELSEARWQYDRLETAGDIRKILGC